MSDEEGRVQGARELHRVWFQELGLEPAINAAFDRLGFTQDYVDSCVAARSRRSSRSKAIKDSVWGMMSFNAAAMRLIDSPVIQRLRRIRQLGFSYLTYPSAEHSRFIHSIGMAHVVSRFVDTIDRRKQDHEDTKSGVTFATLADLKPLTADDLIHAAILHDVGHLPFSHAAENAVNASPSDFTFGSGVSYEDFRAPVETYLGRSSLSEALSILVVLAPRFKTFYDDYVCDKGDGDEVFRIACLIAGEPPVTNCLNIQKVISSSAVDADKIDYVSRDAAACGIPVGVDVSRVYLGSSLLHLDAIQAAKLDLDEPTHVFALNASGWDTFDEILRSRSALYQRVYLHGVTRTAEALYARALQLNARTAASQPQLRDVLELWAENDESTLAALAGSEDPDVRRLGVRLRDRQLPKKAVALTHAVVEMQVPLHEILAERFGEAGRKRALNLIVKEFEVTVSRRQSSEVEAEEAATSETDALIFENEIIAEAKHIRALIDPDNKTGPTEDLDAVALIKIAGPTSIPSDEPVFQHGEILSARDFTNVHGVVDASEIYRAIGYVMSPLAWREIVLMATRTVVYRRSLAFPETLVSLPNPEPSGPELPVSDENPDRIALKPLSLLNQDDIVGRVGASRDNLRRVTARCVEAGYFDTFPMLAPRSSPTTGPNVKIAHRYSQFEGEGGWRVTPASVAAFIDQFPPGLRIELQQVLLKGTFLRRNEVARGLRQALSNVPFAATGKLICTPLTPSSGGVAATAVRALSEESPNVAFAATLSDALARAQRENGCIVFVDDNAVSGTQASAQLWAHLHDDRADWPTHLRHEGWLFEKSIKAEEREALRGLPVAIAVVVGHPTAAAATVKTADDLGLTRFQGLHYLRIVGDGLTWSDGLRSYLHTVGCELLANERCQCAFGELTASDDRSFCEERAFGYGGLGGVTVLADGVPTSTVTGLWMPGRVNGRPWIPLFLRMGRLKNLVLA
jgi:HD superfamily phosphohydrolase